jgi:threonine dehydrogenase-like Zn-dependent dehydrogenase
MLVMAADHGHDQREQQEPVKGRKHALRSYGHNVTVHISRVNARPVIPQVLKLISTGSLCPETVTTTMASIEDAPTALRGHYLAGAVKTVLTA